jgi:predicted porin
MPRSARTAPSRVRSAPSPTAPARRPLYASAFYHFDKFTEVYLAGDYMKLKDASFLTVDSSKKQTELAVGMRTRF